MKKGVMYMSTMPKGEAKGLLAFVASTIQHQAALNGVHRDVGHQGQQRTLALVQERFWWPMMTKDCCALMWGCQCCHMFKGALPKVPLFSIKSYMPLS